MKTAHTYVLELTEKEASDLVAIYAYIYSGDCHPDGVGETLDAIGRALYGAGVREENEKTTDDVFSDKVVELVSHPVNYKTREVVLNDEYTAEIHEEHVTVGCQRIPWSAIDELVKARKELP